MAFFQPSIRTLPVEAMTQPPSLGSNSSSSPQPPRRPSRLKRVVFVLGGIVVVGGVAGAIAAQYFIYNRLAPRVETILSDTLERPVELGDVDGFSLSGIVIDGASVPPTEDDANYAVVDQVQVGFRPLHVISSLVRDRTLPLTITLIDPLLYGAEDAQGDWIRFDRPPLEEEPPITVEVSRVQVRNATLIAAPYPQALESPWENDTFFEDLTALDPQAPSFPEGAAEEDAPSAPVVLRAINIVANLRDENRFISFDGALQGPAGGDIAVRGEADLEQQEANVVVRTTDLQVAGFTPLVPVPGQLTDGSIDTNLRIEYRPDQPLTLNGTARIRDIVAQLDVAPQAIADLNGRLRFDGQDIFVENTTLDYGALDLRAAGRINLETGYDLTAQLNQITLEDVSETFNLDIPFSAAGTFAIDAQVSGALDSPVVSGTLQSVERLRTDQIDFESVVAQFRLSPPVLDISDIAVVPVRGGRIVGSGQVNLEADGGVFFDMQLVDLPGDEFAQAYNVTLPNDYRIGRFSAEVEVFGPFSDIQALADWRLTDSSFAGQGEIRYTGNTVRLQNTRLSVDGGTVVADATADLEQGTWQADVSTTNVDVGPLVPQIDGILTSDVQLSGSLEDLDPAAIALSGTARLANAEARLEPGGPSLLEPGTWTTNFRWTGDGIRVEDFTAPGVDASGFVAINLGDNPVVGALDLDVAVQDYDLSRIQPLLPAQAQQQARVGGIATFDGQLIGSLINPEIVGNLQLENLAINEFAFESTLEGDVQFSLEDGGRVDLAGDGDRLFVEVDDELIPTEFVIRNTGLLAAGLQLDEESDFVVEGQTTNGILTAQIRNFPLTQLQLNPLPDLDLGTVQGIANANIAANIADLGNPSVSGGVAIARPGIGYIQGESFVAQFTYQNKRIALSDGTLEFGDSTYVLDAQANLGAPELSYQAELTVVEGYAQDVLALLQWSTLEDVQRGFVAPRYEGEVLLGTPEAGLGDDAPLSARIAYINRIIDQLQAQQARQDSSPIPPLDSLEGEFQGTITASGALNGGFLVAFDMEGKDWAWEGYDAPNSFVAQGTATPQAVNFQPFRFDAAEDTLVSLQGQIGIEQPSNATLEVANVPIGLIQDFVALPVNLEGDIMAIAQFGGTIYDPDITGEISLDSPVLNGTELEQVALDLDYDEARLIIDGGLFVENRDGMTIAADIPYALPFMRVQPTSAEIFADVDVNNEGLVLLDVASQGQARWEGGEGNVDLRVTGTLAQPLIQGTIAFRDGAIASPLLDEPVTKITGTATFNLNRVEVEQITAQFSDGGITIQGSLPLFNALVADPEKPLTVVFEETPLNVEELFAANVDGQLTVTGAVLAPVVGGAIEISDGRVFARRLARGNTDQSATPVFATIVDDGIEDNFSPTLENVLGSESENREMADALLVAPANPFLAMVELNNLEIFLRDSLSIVGRPFFEIAANGSLVVNGTLADLQPNGTIELSRGWINLFSTQFRLDQDAPNTATFTPAGGIDPDLNVRMVARVREVERVPIAPSSPFATAEVADQSTVPTFGGIQTVEIFATADGRASEISDSLELTSDPTRSENQLVALLGGRTLDAIQGGNPLAGVASYLGAGYLAGFTNDIADALGLTEFSIFPTTGDVGGESRTALAVGVEFGFDITSNFSVSVTEIIDGTTNPLLNLRYQLTDEFRIRAATDFDEDNRAVLEYSNSF